MRHTWASTIAMIGGCIVSASGFAATPKHLLTARAADARALQPTHIWKMVAQVPTGVMFVDLKSFKLVALNEYDYWSLMTPKDEQLGREYIVALTHMDCAKRTLSFRDGTAYTDPEHSRDMGASRATSLPPESLGERVWLYTCQHEDRYPSVQRSYSIQEARSVAQALGATDGGFSRLLNDADIQSIAHEVNDTQVTSGAMGVQSKIEDCYRALATVDHADLRHSAAYCITLDITGYQFDEAFRKVFKEKTSHDAPQSPYYDEALFSARVNNTLKKTTVDGSTPSAGAGLKAYTGKVWDKIGKLK